MHKHEVTIMYVKQYQHAFLLLVNIFKRWDIVRGETLSSQPGEWPYSINSISVYAVLLTFQWKYRSTKIINFTVLYSDLKNQFMHRVKLPVFWFFFKHSFLDWHWIYCVSILQDVYVPALNVCMQASCFGVMHNQKILTEIIKKKINKFIKYHSVSFISHPRRS